MVVLRLSRYQTAQLPTNIAAAPLRLRDKDEGRRVADQSGIGVARRCNTAQYYPGTFRTQRDWNMLQTRLTITTF